MHYTSQYVKQLEDLIMDKLLPGYIENCRNSGIDPKTNQIISDLMKIRRSKREIPYLLKNKNEI